MMHALLIVVGINAAMLGVAFTFGGFATIVAPSTAENEELCQAIEAARARSWFHGQAEAFRQAARAKVSGLSVFVAHWPERPEGRRLVYVGSFCLAIAAAIGYHFGVFDS
jgi:hypothetical protein